MKNLGLKIIFPVVMLLVLVGCASVNSVSLTQIPAGRNNVISAQVSKTVFLGFSFDNDFIDPLVDDLRKKCPNGVVSGILTKDEVISYLIVFKHKVTATGFCNGSVASNKNPNRKSASESPLVFGDETEPGMGGE